VAETAFSRRTQSVLTGEGGLGGQFVTQVRLAGDELEEAVVAQQIGVVLVLIAGDDGVEALDEERSKFVFDVGGVPVIAKAFNDAVGEGDAVVELAEGQKARVGGYLAAVEVEADFPVLTEGEPLLDRALCTHGRSLAKRRFGLSPRHFDAPAVFLSQHA